MSVLRFIFPFLYARDWHTGRVELSRPRMVLFAGMCFIVILGVLMAAILQAPVLYGV